MFRFLGQIYARRIVNVNVNIVLAGFLALGPTLLVVKLVEHLFKAGFHPNERLRIPDKAAITGVTFLADLVFDVAIYYLLHWLANHSHKRKRQVQLETIAEAAIENVPFFKDATKVQFQRLVLSPLLYLLFLGGQFLLMTVFHIRPVLATVIGFAVGITAARLVHTVWMLREQRAQRLAAIRAARAVQSSAVRLAADGVEAGDRACREQAGAPAVGPAPASVKTEPARSA